MAKLGLSLLVFSRNDASKAISLVRKLYDIADEIVLVDSSGREGRRELAVEKERLGLSKMRIFYVVPLGYPDPMREYALGKCRNDWILLLDTDEVLSEELCKNLKEIIGNASASAFAIRRYEEVNRYGKDSRFSTWQVRLFRKSMTTYRGLRHEQPMIDGRLARLDGNAYYINHLEEVKGATSNESIRLEALDERLSYEIYNMQFLEYVGKFMMPEGSVEGTWAGRSVKGFLSVYERLGGKKPGDELSDFDYFMFNVFRDLGYIAKGRPLVKIFRIWKDQKAHLDRIKEWKRSPDSRENFEISKAINRVGIIRFLDLDKESTIRRLNSKYKDKKGGIGLLVELLHEQYRRKRR